jgi:hypothetical protein
MSVEQGSESDTPHAFEDGFVNPPFPRLENGDVDLNEFARQSREGERRPVMTFEEALNRPGGHHNIHMVNPELHPPEPGEEVDLSAIQDAFKAAKAAKEEPSTDTDGTSRN